MSEKTATHQQMWKIHPKSSVKNLIKNLPECHKSNRKEKVVELICLKRRNEKRRRRQSEECTTIRVNTVLQPYSGTVVAGHLSVCWSGSHGLWFPALASGSWWGFDLLLLLSACSPPVNQSAQALKHHWLVCRSILLSLLTGVEDIPPKAWTETEKVWFCWRPSPSLRCLRASETEDVIETHTHYSTVLSGYVRTMTNQSETRYKWTLKEKQTRMFSPAPQQIHLRIWQVCLKKFEVFCKNKICLNVNQTGSRIYC